MIFTDISYIIWNLLIFPFPAVVQVAPLDRFQSFLGLKRHCQKHFGSGTGTPAKFKWMVMIRKILTFQIVPCLHFRTFSSTCPNWRVLTLLIHQVPLLNLSALDCEKKQKKHASANCSTQVFKNIQCLLDDFIFPIRNTLANLLQGNSSLQNSCGQNYTVPSIPTTIPTNYNIFLYQIPFFLIKSLHTNYNRKKPWHRALYSLYKPNQKDNHDSDNFVGCSYIHISGIVKKQQRPPGYLTLLTSFDSPSYKSLPHFGIAIPT